MFGNTLFTATVGAAPRPTDNVKAWTTYARTLAGVGLPVLLVAPGTKRPLDMRTPTEVKADTEAAGGGKTGGVHLGTTDPKRLERYIKRALADPAKKRAKTTPAPVAGPLNWAVRLAESGYVVADADTPAEVDALNAYLTAAYGHAPGPTVLTPGTLDGSHSGGGHWWFKLPEGTTVDPAKVPAVLKVEVEGRPAGFSLYTGNAYVLIPPSVRDAGPYSLVGTDNEAPAAMVELLNHALEAGVEREQKRAEYAANAKAGKLGTFEQQVCEWSSNMPWAEVLEPHGWVDTGTVDSCGCPVYTAPGTHASPKSATAHEGLCTTGRYDMLNPPLHLWTDNPGPELAAEVAKRGGTKTLSKLTVWAAYEHGGDMAAALEAAGIEPEQAGHLMGVDGEFTNMADGTAESVVDAAPGEPPAAANSVEAARELAAEPEALPPVHPEHVNRALERRQPPKPPIELGRTYYTVDGRDVWALWGTERPADAAEAAELRPTLPPWGAYGEYGDMPPVDYVVDGLIEHRGMSAVIGDSGVGKSAIVLDMAAHIVAGMPWHGRKVKQCPVVYVAGEGVRGAVERLKAWELSHPDAEIKGQLYIVEEAITTKSSRQSWAYLTERVIDAGAGLVIFDTLARMTTGLDENSATDMGLGITIFDRLQKATGAGVMLVHHTARGSSHARGSTALRGAVDSEVLVTDVMADGRPFATDGNDMPVDANGDALPGKPVTVKVVKQKNAAEGDPEYLCLTEGHGSIVVTDLDGNAATPTFAQAGATQVTAANLEPLETTAERVTEFVARYKSGELMPTMADIARGVVPDRGRDYSVRAWRAHVGLAVDRALERRMFYKVGAGFTVHPPLD